MKTFIVLAAFVLCVFGATSSKFEDCQAHDWDCDIRGFWDEIAEATLDERSNELYLEHRANFIRFDGDAEFYEFWAAVNADYDDWDLAHGIIGGGQQTPIEFWSNNWWVGYDAPFDAARLTRSVCEEYQPTWVYIYRKQYELSAGEEGQSDIKGQMAVFLDKAFIPDSAEWRDYCEVMVPSNNDEYDKNDMDPWRWVYPTDNQKFYSELHGADSMSVEVFGYADGNCAVQSVGTKYQTYQQANKVAQQWPSQYYFYHSTSGVETIRHGCDPAESVCSSWSTQHTHWTGEGAYADTDISGHIYGRRRNSVKSNGKTPDEFKEGQIKLPSLRNYQQKKSIGSRDWSDTVEVNENSGSPFDTDVGVCLRRSSRGAFRPQHLGYSAYCSPAEKLIVSVAFFVAFLAVMLF